MAATNSTTNLGLPQWVATDKPERTDFNTAMSDIDNTVAAHLAENAKKHITESGSNENGHYIRFDDGTQICWGAKSLGNINTAWGSGFRTPAFQSTPYPKTFIDTPSVTVVGDVGTAACWGGTEKIETGLFQPILLRFTASTDGSQARWTAIGRWK